MAELYDKSGNPIEEIYDEEGNQIDETLTSEEVDQRIQEAKDEAMSEYKSDLDSIKEELEEKKIELKFAEEALDKEKEKDKNFGNLRKTKEEKEAEIENLKTEIKGLRTNMEQVMAETKRQPVNTVIKKMAGDDEELEKKIRHFYDGFAVPENDTEELQQERIKNAFTLATGGNSFNPLTGDAIGSGGGGRVPSEKEGTSEGKISADAKSVAKNLGISEKELKRNKLI